MIIWYTNINYTNIIIKYRIIIKYYNYNIYYIYVYNYILIFLTGGGTNLVSKWESDLDFVQNLPDY